MLTKEKRYQFRERMLQIHSKNIRDLSRTPTEDEVVLKNGLQVMLPDGYTEVTLTAVQDFIEYLFVSMQISAMPLQPGEQVSDNSISLRITPSQTEDYQITFGETICISGKNERGLAQALYCLEDKMTARKAPYLKQETISHTFLFSPRMVHSGYALDKYPNEHLSQIAHAGMDAILIFVTGVNKTPSGYLDFNELVLRAARYGIDVYAYSYLHSEKHPDEPDAQEFYDNLYGEIFKACPGLKGVVLVGESVGFPSKDEHVEWRAKSDDPGVHLTGKPAPGWWPCYDYPEWLACVKQSVRKHRADADIVFWTYNWGYVAEEERLKLIRSLPTDISLLVTYEMFHQYELGSVREFCADYTLSFAGPGTYFVSEAKAAKERGIRLYAMTNTAGQTWDMGVIPYEPMPYQWMKRYEGLREANEKWGLCGLMESHHYGFFPSFIGDLAKQCYIKEATDLSDCLKQVISARFGEEHLETYLQALRLWSEAITHYVPSDADQYGSFRIGPAYPFALIKEMKPKSMDYAHFQNWIVEVMYPADYHPSNRLPTGRGMLPFMRVQEEIASLTKMLQLIREGCRILQTIPNPNREGEYLYNLGKYICCYVQTGIHAKEWYYLSTKLKSEAEAERILELVAKMEELLEHEKTNAEEAMQYTALDSRLGWEPSMEYLGDTEQIQWKLKHLEYVRSYELQLFKKNCRK